MKLSIRSTLAFTLAVLATSMALAPALSTQNAVAGEGLPADKMAVAGSGIDILGTAVTSGSNSEVVDVLAGTLKLSTPTDLVIDVSLECALWTDVVTVGNAESESLARVVVWVEVDGEPVPVAGDDEDSPGEVVFCDRVYRMETARFENENATVRQFLRTRTANSFTWISIDPGIGADGNVHDVVVKARLEANSTTSDNPFDETGLAQAGIGKRTLVVEPVKLANDATI